MVSMDMLISANNTLAAALDFIKLGPPFGSQHVECGYCTHLIDPESDGLHASEHFPDCPWIAFAKTAFPALVVT